jgi:competence ComEA-like helix-hairpin-helix protein
MDDTETYFPMIDAARYDQKSALLKRLNADPRTQIVRILFLPLFMLISSGSLASDLPEGKGKDVVADTCTECHSLRRIKAQRLDEEGWKNILREMTENGASIEQDDRATIVEYLTRNFGPDAKVNVNTADADEIGAVLHLTPAEAKAIVSYRKANGAFRDLDTLEKASGAADKIEAKKALVEF